MKFLAKFALSLVAIYVALWIALAAYFTFSEQYKNLLESNLSAVFKRPVSIDSVQTDWHNFSPTIQINGFSVAGDSAEQPALAFQRMAGRLDPLSVLLFWPSFIDIAIEQPDVQIKSLDSGLLQIAGITVRSNSSSSINPKRIIAWLLDNENAAWHDGSIAWHRLDGSVERYSDISFVYQREQQDRSVRAVVKLPEEGTLAFKLIGHGDVIHSDEWDASLEVLGNQSMSLLGPDDLSMAVVDGKGQLLLKRLRVRQVSDFLQLTGIGGARNWILQSQLSGQLSDVTFEFSGPLLDFNDWSLTASAANVAFKSTNSMPAMTNLNGSIEASSKGGVFDFTTQSAEFSWQRWFAQPIPIVEASGKFEWDLSTAEKISVKLSDGIFSDNISSVRNLNASVEIALGKNRISNFADLFKTGSIKDLSFQGGEIVSRADEFGIDLSSVYLDASAEFAVSTLALVEQYFPKDPRIQKFHKWWQNAVISGSAANGVIEYQGSITKEALYDGTAQLRGHADFYDVELDYGYERDWPLLSKGKGLVKIDDTVLTFIPEEAWLDGDRIEDATVKIDSLYRRGRELTIQASMDTSLPKVMDFLFAGPLLSKEESNNDQALPITSDGGEVSAKVQVNIPLNKVRETKLTGTAKVSNGQLLLPEAVPVTEVAGDVRFTEQSAYSDNIRGLFLGGVTSAKLITTEEAQPPKLRLSASGTAHVEELQPWVGEHLLTWFDGETDWQGIILVDGPSAQISTTSNMKGVEVKAPAPLRKTSQQERKLNTSLQVGKDMPQLLTVMFGDGLVAKFAGDLDKDNHLMNKSIISLGGDTQLKEGINFDIQYDQINLDDWLEAVIELAKLETKSPEDTLFLDSMRSVKVNAGDPFLLGRQFGSLKLSAVSSNGGNWIGSITGENVDGIVQAEPRADVGSYRFNLSKLYIAEGPEEKPPLDPIDQSLSPDSYPVIDLNVNSFRFVRKQLGQLRMRGEPIDGAWRLTNFELNHQGVSTTAEGEWVNTSETGTISNFNIETVIDEAGGALQELDMGGFVRKGEGELTATINWIGAPHEFDYSRLNGDFDLRVQDGELVKIESGTGRLLGLLNFNAIARRLTLDFSDVFSSGLEFDRMRYAGVFADGEAIMREAYIFTPAVFVRMEGKLDLDKELIDMEIHMAPDLGGNLTLLSALANPAAGAVVFLTQQIFKDEMRAASYKSYRALGTWEDFEMVEFNLSEEQANSSLPNSPAQKNANSNTN